MSDGLSVSRRLASFRYASRGIGWMVRTQPNAWIHAGASVAVIVVGMWVRLTAGEWCWLVLAISGVWAAEAFNTALEALADGVSPERNPLVGRAKDSAAGAVLLSAVGAATIGLLVLGPHLWERL
jgi:diacylglycerol kinase (ATP)